MFPSPLLAVPTLNNFEFEFNGLKFGADTAFAVLGAEGLDLAEIRSGDTGWSRDFGQAMGLDLYGGRDITFDLWMKSNGTSLQSSQLELAAASVAQPNAELPLWFQLPNLPLMCVMCRPRHRKMKIDSDYAAANIGKPELSLHATDPRIYQAGVATVISPNHPASTGVLANGNTEMRPILVFNGPLARPRATNLSIAGDPYIEVRRPNAAREKAERKAAEEREKTEDENIEKWNKELAEKTITKEERDEKEAAQKVAMEKAVKEEGEAFDKEEAEGAWPTVLLGEQLTVDLGVPHRVETEGGGNAMEWLVVPGSTWWDLVPGNNTIQFSSFDDTNTGGTCEVQWAPANEI